MIIVYKLKQLPETVDGGLATDGNRAKGGSVYTSGYTTNTSYLSNNGNNGVRESRNYRKGLITANWKTPIGGNSVMISNGNIDLGIGKDRGTGGDLYDNYAENGLGKGFNGVGGCLYLFSAKTYCLCTVNVPDGTHTKLVVTGDALSGKPHSGVGTIEGDKTQYKFIVRKGATVSYTLTKTGYTTKTGTFPTGQNLDISTNIQTENLSLGTRRYLTHTFKSNGAHIKLTGTFYRNDGSTYNVEEGNNTVTVKVAEDVNSVGYTVTKTHYETKTGSENIVNDGQTTNISLTPIKYLASSVSYAKDNKGYNFFGWHEYNSWKATNKINNLSDTWKDVQGQEDSGERDVIKFEKSGWGEITLSFNNTTAVSDWRVTFYKFRAGNNAGSSYMDVWVYNNAGQQIGSKTYSFSSKDTDYTESLSFTNQSIKTVKVKLRAENNLNRRLGIAAVYVENTK